MHLSVNHMSDFRLVNGVWHQCLHNTTFYLTLLVIFFLFHIFLLGRVDAPFTRCAPPRNRFCRGQALFSRTQDSLQMLWLAAYLTGFPPVGLHALRWTHCLARTLLSTHPLLSVYGTSVFTRFFMSK